jgi:nucleoside-diphosphate-sugar epimerase
MKRLLVFGLSGQIGTALAPLLEAGGYSVLAISRKARLDTVAIRWQLTSLETAPTLPGGFDAILSLGPLDAFADWLGSCQPATPRVIAIGSTSGQSKADVSDPHERLLAANLSQAETRLRDACADLGIGLTVLRPTLVYGNGRDQSLTPMLALARRWRLLPWPYSATGLRQPVHVEDLARALLQCLERPETAGHSFDLPGGETLTFAAMLKRSARVLAPEVRLLPTPLWAFGLALKIAARASGQSVSAPGIVRRLTRDQLFDAEPARLAFGYDPRRFSP